MLLCLAVLTLLHDIIFAVKLCPKKPSGNLYFKKKKNCMVTIWIVGIHSLVFHSVIYASGFACMTLPALAWVFPHLCNSAAAFTSPTKLTETKAKKPKRAMLVWDHSQQDCTLGKGETQQEEVFCPKLHLSLKEPLLYPALLWNLLSCFRFCAYTRMYSVVGWLLAAWLQPRTPGGFDPV